MKSFNRTLLLFTVLALLTVTCKKKDEDSLDNVDCSTISSAYSSSIKPIMTAKCTSSGCHNAGSANGDFTTYAGLKAKADNGSLNSRVLVGKSMPPTGPLPLDELKKIKCWLNAGAPNN